jgi:hypothetical protein
VETLKVGDKRQWRSTGVVFEIKAIYLDQAIIDQLGKAYPIDIRIITDRTTSYQEPKPVRKLEAWETKGNGIARGTIEFCLSDSESSIYNKEHANEYRKLSDEELKELIKGVIGE